MDGDLVTKSCPTLMTPWTIALQSPLSMGFSRQEYSSGLPFPSPGDLPGAAVEPRISCFAGDVRDLGSVPELGRSPGEGNGNPLQYSCLVNPMHRGTWWVTVHRVAELDTTEAIEYACISG